MDVVDILILLCSGALGGFLAGLAGVGGGIIFAPVLFYYFQLTGVPADVLAPLTVGTSLLCTTVASMVSTWHHHQKRVVDWRVAVPVGLLSAFAVFLVVQFVATQPWYDKQVFQRVFGILLLLVAIRMVLASDTDQVSNEGPREGLSAVPILASIGSVAGAVAAAAGVGGGVILVPAYHQILRKPMPAAVGTSSATIIFISGIGVVTYALSGGVGLTNESSVFGYVDVARGLLLALPTVLTARYGALAAHRMNKRLLRISFALIASLVAIRMLAG